MDDKMLLRVALVTAVVGLFVFLLIVEKVEVGERSIAKIDELPEGKEIKVVGVVQRVSQQETVAFIELAEEKIETITVVLFKDKNVSINEGDFIEVVGSLEEYRGKKEIIGNKVEIK